MSEGKEALLDQLLEAIEKLRELIDALPEGSPALGGLQDELGKYRIRRNDLTGEIIKEHGAEFDLASDKLDKVISDIQDAIDDTTKAAAIIGKVAGVVTALADLKP